jgi:hypothetical protein
LLLGVEFALTILVIVGDGGLGGQQPQILASEDHLTQIKLS